MRNTQEQALKEQSLFVEKKMQAYGGELRKKAKNRTARPLLTKSGSMHITLRSSQAKGICSFQHSDKRQKTNTFIRSFSKKKGVQILSFANVGNHIHLHVKLTNRTLYKAWIRGLSSGLAMISQGLKGFQELRKQQKQFWDHRPFSKLIQSLHHYFNTKSYVEINVLQGMGIPRLEAEILVKGSRHLFRKSG